MEDTKLDRELQRIYSKLSFLWVTYDFHLKYLTRSYGMYNRGFLIGMENNICRLVLEKETESIIEPIRTFVGHKTALFLPPDYSHLASNGWYPVAGLLFWLTGVQCERYKNVDDDLESVSQFLKLNIDRLLDLFKDSDSFDSTLQYYRDLHKDEQITVEKLRVERARLQSLGLDSSIEAAIASLRGGKNE